MQLCVVAVNHSKRSLEVLSISFDHILSIDIVLHKITMGNQEIELFTCDTPSVVSEVHDTNRISKTCQPRYLYRYNIWSLIRAEGAKIF